MSDPLQPPAQAPAIARTLAEPLFVLSPPRSFSSVVSAMLGQHPDLYSFPELNLFAGRTLEQAALYQRGVDPASDFPPGLLRAVAELHHGSQDFESIEAARRWLEPRRAWTTRKLYDYLRHLVYPRVAVDKSPRTAMSPWFLDVLYLYYPNARFIHLTRHPVPSIQSLLEHWRLKIHELLARPDEALFVHRCARIWHDTHRNILEFLRILPKDRYIRVAGETLLSRPEEEMRRIARWLGIRTDEEAIDAMRHPERWPFASPGPANAPYANDPKFMRAPRLRPVEMPEGLEMPVAWDLEPGLAACITRCAAQLGYR